MPTQTKFICPSGGVNVDFSGVFEELNGGTSYGSATNFKVGALDLTGYFHASTSVDDRPSFYTGFKATIGGTSTDLSAIFRRRGFINDPVITSQPSNQIKYTTQSVTFSVTFNSTQGGTYQWKKNGINISGASGSFSSGTGVEVSYTKTVAMGDQASYSCVIAALNTVTTSAATLNISPRIISTGDPAGSYTRYYGSTNSQVLNLQITSADGETQLSYQWYKNNISLGSSGGANTSEYTKTIDSGDSGTYKCTVTNAYGNATTGNFVITASNGVPSITSQPTNQVVVNNSTAAFSVTAYANGATIGYQWKRGGDDSNVVGETSGSYTTGSLTTGNDTDSYYCSVYTSYGGIDSNTVSTKIKPYITTQPLGASLNETDGVSLSVTAAGSPILYYQWRKNGTDISGATSSSYPSSGQFALNLSTVGTYTCKVTSTHDSTGVISSGAVLTIIPPTITSISPSTGSYNYNDGDGITFIVTATATNLTYSFYRGVILVQSGASNQYAFSVSETNNGTYECTVSNNGGSVDSAPVTIVRFYQNSITAQPTNQTAIVNGSNDAAFSISANGNAAPTYQWQENDGGWNNLSNGARVSGATSSQLSILNVESGDDGRLFRCVVSNKKANGSDNWNNTTSSEATLTVEYAPTLGSVTVDATTVTSDLEEFGISNGNSFDLQAVGVDDGQPNATTKGWYKYDGTSSPDGNGYNTLVSSNNTVTISQGNNSTEYYRFRMINTRGTADSYEIQITTS